jgi:hypothetical protein
MGVFHRQYQAQNTNVAACMLCAGLLAVSVLGQSQSARGGEREPKTISSLNDREKLTEQLLESVKSHLAEPQLNELFYRTDLSISFAAFWGRVVQRPGSSPTNALVNMGRFVGIIEKSLGVSVPPWWTGVLNRSEHGATVFPSPAD